MDNVKCSNCGFDGLVETGSDKCPKCGYEGVLAWKEGEPQEVEDTCWNMDARYRLVEDAVGEFCMDCGRDTPEACEGCPIRELMDDLESILTKIPIT